MYYIIWLFQSLIPQHIVILGRLIKIPKVKIWIKIKEYTLNHFKKSLFFELVNSYIKKENSTSFPSNIAGQK